MRWAFQHWNSFILQSFQKLEEKLQYQSQQQIIKQNCEVRNQGNNFERRAKFND